MTGRTLRRVAVFTLVGDMLWTTVVAQLLHPPVHARGIAFIVWLSLQWALFALFFRSTSPGTGVAAGVWALVLGTVPSGLPSLPMAAFVVFSLIAWRRQRIRIARTRPWEKESRRRSQDDSTSTPSRERPGSG